MCKTLKIMDIRHIIIYVSLFLSLPVLAQQKPGKFDPKQFQADLEQFIVKEAVLTPSDAEVFFPVYREYNEKKHALALEARFLNGYKPLSDEQCREAIEKEDEYEIKIKELQMLYHKKYLRILPASKVYDILRAEDKFHRQSFRDMSRDK